MNNALYLSDNLPVLRQLAEGSVDLVYLDPPFASQASYAVSSRSLRHRAMASLGTIFHDSWRYGPEAESALRELRDSPTTPSPLRHLLAAVSTLLGPMDSSMLAYVAMMAPRLVEVRRVLKPSGSVYLHCDSSAGAYLKLLCDAIFGSDCFLNEIIWSYRRWPTKTRYFQRMHDVIYFYARQPGAARPFHVAYEPISDSYRKRFGGATQRLDPARPSHKLKSEQPSVGMPQRDVWELSILAGSSRERVGYPTQKPELLLERIIRASSREGDLVLDPFCGSGTALICAEKLHRRWIGIDIAPLGVAHTRRRLHHRFALLLQPMEFHVESAHLPQVEELSAKLGALPRATSAPKPSRRPRTSCR